MAKNPSTKPAPSRTDALTNAVLEGMRKHLFRHACPGVGHRYHYEVAGTEIARAA